jgi:hypothetical protein
MARRAILFAALLTFGSLVVNAMEFHLKLAGGLSLFNPLDMNHAILDWVGYNQRDAESRNTWTYLEGKTPQHKNGVDFGGELVLQLSSRLAVSVGSGFTYSELGSEDTEVRILKPLGETIEVQPRTLSAIPLIFSGYYHMPLSSRLRVYAKAGGGFVWAKHVEREGSRRITNQNFSYSRTENATARGPLYQAGLGLDFAIESEVRFFIEGIYRSLRMQSFSGATESGEIGTLYNFEEYHENLDFWQIKNRLLLQPPTGENIRSVRETELDLSGFFLVLGVAIRF